MIIDIEEITNILTSKKIKIITPIEFKETKICHKCKVEKPRNDFFKNKSAKDGLQSSCKSCRKEYNILNKEKISQRENLYKLNLKLWHENNTITIESKLCTKCKTTKDVNQFVKNKYTKNGLSVYCKDCCRKYYQDNKETILEKCKISGKLYRENNKEKNRLRGKKYYENNKEATLKRQRKYYFDNIEKKKIYSHEYRKKYYIKNKDKELLRHRNYRKKRIEADPLYKLICATRSLIKMSIKGKGYKKITKTETLLGCSYQEFKNHLEKQFQTWMHWDNYGNPKNGTLEPNKNWDIDHIIPMSTAKTEEDIIRLNNYTNLRPLCSYTNRIIKKDKI